MRSPICLALVFVAALGASGCANDVDRCVNAGMRYWDLNHGKRFWPNALPTPAFLPPWSTNKSRALLETRLRQNCLELAAGPKHAAVEEKFNLALAEAAQAETAEAERAETAARVFIAPSGREYEWDKPTPPTEDDWNALIAYEDQQAKP